MILPLAVMALLVVLIVPLPTVLIDVLLAVNISVTILLLLVTLGVGQPLEMSVFPSALLLITLSRLSLNVASTRLILLQADAGRIIEAFGNIVVGGNLVVGLVVFLILVIIQFVVITKGATRISEVGARFVLDAMPGKQMAIDADLNANAINDVEAKRRRAFLLQEAEFFGAMDGASKFVRGDAVAGLVIVAINLVGGIIIGLINGMPLAQAVRTYSILSVGDGLVTQIPALITATAAGLLVTKSSTQVGLGSEIGSQFLTKRRPLQMAAGILALVSLAPGMPTLPFLALAAALWLVARRLAPSASSPEAKTEAERPHVPLSPMEEHLAEFLETDRACIEIGSHLIPLVDPKRGIGLLQRIATLRRDLGKRSGLWVPLVRVRDNSQLEQDEYRILVGGQEGARGYLRIDQVLAIHPEGARIHLPGVETKDPAFGLPAKWIAENDRSQAEMSGCTVVDAPGVMITHLREVLRRHAADLLSREDVTKLMDRVKESSAAVVDELIPNMLSMGAVHRVLTLLLEERVPITNLTRILESLAHNAPTTKDPIELAERSRGYLTRAICEPFIDEQGRIHALVFDPLLEIELRRSLQDKKVAIPADALEALIVRLATACRDAGQKKFEVALLVDSQLRRPVRQLLTRGLPDLAVVAYTEVPNEVLLEAETIIRRDEIFGTRPVMEAT
ncbi:MAG: FHIPEP family type III secretion protein [Planctomycetales bacterium]|nr:FHIPEP family type III secretion protein [Planctomycetales bacterium]